MNTKRRVVSNKYLNNALHNKYSKQKLRYSKDGRKRKWVWKPPLPARAFPDLASARRFGEYLVTSPDVRNVLAENRGHVCGRWRRCDSERCNFPCSRVITAAAQLPRPRSLACTHADKTVHCQCIVLVVVVVVAACVRADYREWRCEVEESSAAKNAPRSLYVVNFVYHPRGYTQKQGERAEASWARSVSHGIWDPDRISPGSVPETIGCALRAESKFLYRVHTRKRKLNLSRLSRFQSFFFFPSPRR